MNVDLSTLEPPSLSVPTQVRLETSGTEQGLLAWSPSWPPVSGLFQGSSCSQGWEPGGAAAPPAHLALYPGACTQDPLTASAAPCRMPGTDTSRTGAAT